MVLALASLRPEMVKIAGSKATNLATAGSLGLAVPPGFVITAHAFAYFLKGRGLIQPVQDMLADITADMTPEMTAMCHAIQDRVLQAELPRTLVCGRNHDGGCKGQRRDFTGFILCE
jgi:pyruvate,water dikinase